MIKKNCPRCGGDSFSSYNDPQWICPYCGENLGRIKKFQDNLCEMSQTHEYRDTKVISFSRFRKIQGEPGRINGRTK